MLPVNNDSKGMIHDYEKRCILILGHTRELGGGRGGGGEKASAPGVFGSCSFFSRAHLEPSLVIVSFYGYEI